VALRGEPEVPSLDLAVPNVESDRRGLGICGVGLRGTLADQVGQAWYLTEPANPIAEVIPEADAQLAAG